MPDRLFDHPWGLGLLAALPVVLWLHLRRRRPRRVAVPSLVPWLGVAPSIPPRRRKVPPAVLLAVHLAIAAALALAAAGPRAGGAGPGALDRAVVIDVTTSMAAAGRWSAAVARVGEVLDDTRGAITLVTLEARPRVLVARDGDGRAARAALRRLVPGGVGADAAAALALAAAAAGPTAEVVVVTDGAGDPPPGLGAARWVHVGAPVDNVAVLTAAARLEAGETRLFARVANLGAADRGVPIALMVDGRAVDRRTVTVAASGTFETVWTLPAGARTAEVRLEAGDALPDDDVAAVPLEGAVRRIQLVGASDAMARALSALPGARLERMGAGTFHADGSVPVTVFVRHVPERLPPGGVVLVDPPPGRVFTARATNAEGRVDAAGDHPLVAGLDLAGVVLTGLSDPEVPSWAEPVIRAGDATAAFAGVFGASRLVVLAFDPDAGALAERLAFPIFVARAVAWAAPDLPPPVVSAGAAVQLAAAPMVVGLPDGATVHARGWFDTTRRPGLYTVSPAGAGSGATTRFAVQAGDPAESDLRQPLPEGAAPPAASSGPLGRALWPWLAGLALAVLLAEGAWRGGAWRGGPSPMAVRGRRWGTASRAAGAGAASVRRPRPEDAEPPARGGAP